MFLHFIVERFAVDIQQFCCFAFVEPGLPQRVDDGFIFYAQGCTFHTYRLAALFSRRSRAHRQSRSLRLELQLIEVGKLKGYGAHVYPFAVV